ncbi:restriction endonuclease subunit S [Catenibacterium sp.]|uniref:restriction endonuclease subunit S n=1 Tax=Catenibacterium sp. TaxID=2049022 RepID=UPI00258C15E6|nr:restriction endonuclease subunit S [Catenibacterium sp.]
MEKSRKPKIRFKGYNDDWEQRELGELASSFEYGLNAASKCYDGINKYIRITDIDDETRTFLDTDLTSPDCDLSLSENYLLKDGDILFARTGASAGKTFIYKAFNGVVYYAGFLIRARLKENCSPQFVFYNTLTKEYEKFIRVTSQRSGQPGVNAHEYATFELLLPKYDEQCEIGKFFTNLDYLITLHQRKLEKLMNVKKSMLEKMFPKQGSTVPEIRFNGFTQAWEQRELGELASSFEYGLNAASKCYDGINKYIRITDIDDETRTFLDTDLTSPDCDLSLSENYLLKDGDILFARTGASAGKTFIYKAFNGVVYYAGFLIRARLKENCSPQFVFYNTLTKEYEKFIRVTSQRSGQPGVNAHEYATFELLLPKYDEQCEIGKFFTNLDYLITLHQRKLEKLKNIKKSMLEKMFI